MKGHFREEQKFTQWWLWGLIGITTAPVMFFMMQGMYVQFILDKPWGNQPMSDTGLTFATILTFIIMGGVIMLLFSIKLSLEVHNRTIYYQFSPFIGRNRKINLEDVDFWEVKKYSVIKDFGGYGIRKSFSGMTAYNIKGNMGLKVKLKNGKSYLFGTQRSDELRAAIQSEFDKMSSPDFE